MIKEFEFFHGLIFARLLHAAQRPLSLRCYSAAANSSYVLEDSIGLYIKYSTKRLTPWYFTFKKEHQAEIDAMRNTLGNVFLLLVCNDDGIVCLKYTELKQLLDDQHEDHEWVSVKRTKRQMYTVAGKDGKLQFKVGQNDFPQKLFAKEFRLTPEPPITRALRSSV